MEKLYDKVKHFDKNKVVKKSKEDMMKEKKKKEIVINKLFSIVGLSSNFVNEEIPFEKITDPKIVKKLYQHQKELKKYFSSDKLTSLHQDALEKQEFPGVNLVRQILKELGYKLKPIVKSNGYLGKKKLVKRTYKIIPLKQ